MKVKRPELSVFVLTYNQEEFIAQTLDSIINQQTNFDFEIVIGDDASVD
ncbi:MAG TPA: glycosyl transferase family 2, partial [Leeuwenhoekiella sp.]|nr:glycosyl transferase family 2 [Leeuwenhoekiella sp.]